MRKTEIDRMLRNSPDQVACKKCMQLEKHGIKRRSVFYNDGEYCIQCVRESVEKKKNQKILNENFLKTLDEIREKYGK